MTGYSVDFLGCKISQTDAETVADALATAGHLDDRSGSAAVRVVNTCCITSEAEKKSRQKVRRLLGEGEEDVRVFVTGCGASLNADQYRSIDERVTVLPGAASQAVSAIVAAADAMQSLSCTGPPPGRNPVQRARAFVKIQDGCNFSCSYCIVPTVRGEPRSRTVEAVLEDVARRVARGQSEIVLTGVNIGLFRCPDSRTSLWALLPQIADVEGVTRVRISSIEVNHVSRRLVDAIVAHDKICPHLHVPLQSGGDDVLASMHRHYDSARYRKAIAYAREHIPGLNLTADIIVGYPAETDAAFAETLAFADEMQFTKIHAFPFSPRPGTEADAAADPIDKATKKARSLALREQADRHARTFWESRVGTCDEVIVERSGTRSGMSLTDAHIAAGESTASESVAEQTIGGYTRDYCPVRIDGDAPDGTLVDVEITGFDARGLIARMR